MAQLRSHMTEDDLLKLFHLQDKGWHHINLHDVFIRRVGHHWALFYGPYLLLGFEKFSVACQHGAELIATAQFEYPDTDAGHSMEQYWNAHGYKSLENSMAHWKFWNEDR